MQYKPWLGLLIVLVLACTANEEPTNTVDDVVGTVDVSTDAATDVVADVTPSLDDGNHIGPVPEYPQTEGDPELGYTALINNGYVSCGIPKSLSHLIYLGVEADRIPGRNEQNQDMPYFWTSITSETGVELIVGNCLACHASRFNGELIIGLGDVRRDYTDDFSAVLTTALAFSSTLVDSEEEQAEFEKFVTRAQALAPYSMTRTRGLNPAVSITAGIMEHLDPVTLSWSEEPLLVVPAPYKEHVGGLSVPPWWWHKKKNAMFYSASGAGNHVAWAMLASSMCIEGDGQAEEIASYFPDILAYIDSIEAPEYPWSIDAELALQGKEVFETHCSSCHGTYGEEEYYPNRVVHIDEVGTDPELAVLMFEAEVFHQWMDDSYYGQHSWARPAMGYIAPPLDGVWATAPYLHNSSIPTIAALLDSSTRPTCWTWSYDTTDYDPTTLGWNFQETSCHDAITDPDERDAVYDPSHFGYGNQGHTFGDSLLPEERSAILEYLKTL